MCKDLEITSNFDDCGKNKVVLYYKEGSKHTFKCVEEVGHTQKGGGYYLSFFGQRSFTNTIEKDIVETGTLDYTVSIPRHLVSHYVVHSNEGVTKTERLVKVL